MTCVWHIYIYTSKRHIGQTAGNFAIPGKPTTRHSGGPAKKW